jgi:MraZ protein
MMFSGHYEHAIDAKGRTSVPARFRELLAADGDLRLVLTPALFDPCLDAYPRRAWEEMEAKIATLPRFDPKVVHLRRRYVSAAVECEIDKQGRILVPPALREHAGLEKDVLWAGSGKSAELWSKPRWTQGLALADGELEAFKNMVAELSL